MATGKTLVRVMVTMGKRIQRKSSGDSDRRAEAGLRRAIYEMSCSQKPHPVKKVAVPTTWVSCGAGLVPPTFCYHVHLHAQPIDWQNPDS